MKNDLISILFQEEFLEYFQIIFKSTLLIIFQNELLIWFFLDRRFKKLFSYLRPWFLLNIMITLTFITLFNMFLNHAFISVFLTWTLTTIFAGIHITKFKILGLPLFFWDYINFKEPLLYLTTMIQKKRTWALMICIILTFFFIFYVFLRLPSYSLELNIRIYLFVILFINTIIGFILFKVPYKNFFPANSFRDSAVFKTGLLPFLALTLKYSKSGPVPVDYNQDNIKILQNTYQIHEIEKNELSPKELPNIIIYCIESLMDLNNIGVKLNNHPMPYFESLKDKNGNGFIVSPTFGGQTVQPEFELLTGLSQFQMSVPNPFVHIIRKYKYFPALPSTLKNLGYLTLGIQAVSAHEFQRNKYYPILDFDRFIALETDYPKEDWEMIHNLLSDHYLVKKIKENTLSDEKPIFGLFFSNSTHASYNRWKRNKEFKVLNNNITENTRDILERYASAIHHADNGLKELVQYFQGKSRDTIMLIFGDHLPGLNSVFNDLKSFQRSTYWAKFQTPFRIMSTYELKNNIHEVLSSNLLPIFLFKLLNYNTNLLPPYFKVIETLYKNVDVYSNFIQDKEGKIHDRNNPPDFLSKICRDADLIQYDILEGENYFNKK